jgi:diacylglycerol kinase (ATP)
MSRIAFLINSTIKKYTEVVTGINAAFNGREYTIFPSSHPGHIIQLAKKAAEQHYSHIIVAGGDGTLNEAINGILAFAKTGEDNNPGDFDMEKARQVKVGLLPNGSGNDFSKTIKTDADPYKLKQLIDADNVRPIDIGWSTFFNKQNKPVQRFFVNITDVGMGGEVAKKLEDRIPFLGNTLNYRLAITTTFLSYKKSRVLATADDFRYENTVMNFVIANGKWFGSGLGVAPDAEVNDGKFSVVALGDINILDYAKHLSTVKQCIKVQHNEVKYFQLPFVKVESSDGRKLSIDMDGEFAGYAPMEVRCIPGAISFLY